MAATFHFDIACFQNVGIVCNLEGLVGVLLNEQDSSSGFIDFLNDFKDVVDDEGSEAQGGFVHHNQLGSSHEGSSDSQHLLFSAG